jgi:hypothetical protein
MASSREQLISETILAKWDATAALAISVPGGRKFVITKQPADTSAITEPYCNFTIDIREQKKLAGTGAYPITAIVTFEVYGAVASQVSAAIGDLRNTFCYGQSLAPPTGGAFNAMTEEPGGGIKDQMWKRGGAINWQGKHIAKVVVTI